MNLLKRFERFLFDVDQPSYPPYHKGKYLEQTFLNFYIQNLKEFEKLKHTFIPVYWTDLYLSKPFLRGELQKELHQLDKNGYYFTVSQHDDAPAEYLPPNTINFSAGGNIPNTIPIPLIASRIPNITSVDKDIFCSFVGSVSEPSSSFGYIAHKVRMDMLEALVDKKEYILKPKHWSPDIKKQREDLFLDLTSRSVFTLCPRGYGATSFRLYEAMQLNSIPVYIYHKKPHLPFEDKINWKEICVLIEHEEINSLDNILKNIDSSRITFMRNLIQNTYETYFTLENLGKNIFNILSDRNI